MKFTGTWKERKMLYLLTNINWTAKQGKEKTTFGSEDRVRWITENAEKEGITVAELKKFEQELWGFSSQGEHMIGDKSQ